MAYDATLAARIRAGLSTIDHLVEKKMFGGVGFILNGNMACGVYGDELIVRIPPEESGAVLSLPHTRVFNLTGRPMKGWILVDSAGYATDGDLQAWIERGVAYAKTLPPK
jgi:hypothetical protein